ncbi:peptidoglycan-binding protein [Citrobacter enshiensis]|uniref:peptidoglycan-binding protein n=1 Tax=Citrobacter enshiensis TaxID=2971264 RepID=UPI0023E8DBF9|nr:peptidoglycan-binding domain-containing protein [Citrobacter enshiensis]WET42337.1 peptidoglycan-binding domain-containing protein [Citrobacter enshiensis]
MVKLLLQDSSGPEVVQLRKCLAATLGSDAQMFDLQAKNDLFDETLVAAVRHWQSNIGILADGIVGPYCQRPAGSDKRSLPRACGQMMCKTCSRPPSHPTCCGICRM